MKPDLQMKIARAKRLKTARERYYSTAAEFARSIPGMDEYTYRTYESGRTELAPDKAAVFADKLGISLVWLLTGKNDFDDILSATSRGKITDGGFITATLPLIGEDFMQDVGHLPPQARSREDKDNSALYYKITVETSQYEPYIKRGSEVFYDSKPGNAADMAGELCIIKIKGNKPEVFALLQRGSDTGLYDIQGHGKDLEIEWCALPILIKR